MNSREELTGLLLEALPGELRRRVMKEPWIERALHEPPRHVMHLGGWGSVNVHELLSAVALLFESGVTQTVSSLDDHALKVQLTDDGVEIRQIQQGKEQSAVNLSELMLFSPSREQRRSAWNQVSRRLGPAVPAVFDDLPARLAESPLDEALFIEIVQELGRGVNALQGRARLAMQDGQPGLEQLVPSSIDYYAAFCGPVPQSDNVDEYIASALSAHRSRLVSQGNLQGLDICLMGGMRAELSPVSWVKDLSNDDLWNALSAINAMRDPYSLVNSLDLALDRVEDVRFEGFARSAVQKLTASTFICGERHDGYELLPLLSTLVLDRLNVIADMNTKPPFWKRMCAWMHGTVLLRIIQNYTLNIAELSKWVNGCRSIPALFTRLRDLRSEPMERASEMSRKALIGEVAGRLELLVQKNAVACGKVGLTEALLVYRAELSKTDPYGWFMCGPLEGHRLPRDAGRKLSEEDIAACLEMIETRDFGHMWFGLSTMSQLCDLTEAVVHRATKRTIGITERSCPGELTLLGLSYAALVAAAQRDTRLASAIGNGILVAVGDGDDPDTIGEAIQVLLIAAAANAEQSAWRAWLEQQLAMLCARVPRSSQCAQLVMLLRHLREVLPLAHSPVYRAEAIANAGA